MSRFDERMQQLRDLRDELNEGDTIGSLVVLNEQSLLVQLVEKHMESLESMYRGKIHFLLTEAARAYIMPASQQEEYMMRFGLKPDEMRYVKDVWKALKAIQPPDYLSSEF